MPYEPVELVRPAVPDFMLPSYALDTVPSEVVGNFVGQLNTYIDNEYLVYATALADRNDQIRVQIKCEADKLESREQLENALSNLNAEYDILTEQNRWQTHEIATLSDEEAKFKVREKDLCQTIDTQTANLREYYVTNAGMWQELQEQENAKASLLQQFDEREEETKRRWNITIQSTKKTSDEYIQKLKSYSFSLGKS